jgi:hypothetical protein
MRQYLSKSCLPLIILGIITACTNKGDFEKTNNFLNTEIAGRISSVESSQIHDSIRARVAKIHKRVGELLLLSRDIENIKSNAALTDAYFKSLAHVHGIPGNELLRTNPLLSLHEIELILKQNELTVLNHIVLGAGIKINLLPVGR